jgi:hypothetical protein
MKHSTAVKIVQAFEKLLRQILLMGLLELEGRMIQETREIVGQVFEHHVTIVLLDHDFSKLDDVVMIEGLEELDFAYSGNRELRLVSMVSCFSSGDTLEHLSISA